MACRKAQNDGFWTVYEHKYKSDLGLLNWDIKQQRNLISPQKTVFWIIYKKPYDDVKW